MQHDQMIMIDIENRSDDREGNVGASERVSEIIRKLWHREAAWSFVRVIR